MKRALVTGSNGFLGRHFSSALVEHGYTVTGLDVKSKKQPADILDFLPTHKKKYDIAIHAAAYVRGRVAIEGQRTFLGAYNLQLDACFFQWALRERPRHVVYISSSAVYPVTAQTVNATRSGLEEPLVDVRRDVMFQPDATYGFTKLVGERMASELSDEAENMSVHVVRPFSGYGTDQDLDYPFAAFRQRTLQRDDPFEIWGSGFQVRDWVHVDDVVGATLAVMAKDYCQPMNICTGRATNFFELAQMFVAAAGDGFYTPAINAKLEAPSGVQYRVGDPERMCEVYAPYISLEKGIKMALAK